MRTSIERKKRYYKQKIVVSEDTLLGWKKSLGNNEWGHSLKKKTKDYQKKRSGEWGHLLREKKDGNKQKIVVSEDTLLGWKKFFGISEWRDSLKGKTKDYKRKKIWWGRTSIEKKKDCYKQKLLWVKTHFLDKKNPWEMMSEDLLWRRKQKTIKEIRSGEWGHLLREKKKTATNKRL